jgi:hypothetical protein
MFFSFLFRCGTTTRKVAHGQILFQHSSFSYGGHGICMAFWGVTDDQQGEGVIIETPDDAAIHLRRLE